MKWKLINLFAVILCVLVAAAIFFSVKKDRADYEKIAQEAKEKADEMNDPQNGINLISYNGKKYKENASIKSYLFIGVDERDESIVDEDLTPGTAGQADCLILLILNEDTNKADILQINRNAMTELDIYDELGAVEKTVTEPVCLQYAYSTGGKRSSIAQRKTVDELLFNISIDGYFTMSLQGIGEINDAFGGVDVTMKNDYTQIDPSFIQGSTVHLEGDLATKFVRYRDKSVFNSVQDRMDRQTQYVTSFIKSLKDKGGESLAETLNQFIGSEVITDLNASELNSLINYEYDTDNVLYLPGEMVQGEEYEEYNVDNTELEKMIIDLFYIEAEN